MSRRGASHPPKNQPEASWCTRHAYMLDPCRWSCTFASHSALHHVRGRFRSIVCFTVSGPSVIPGRGTKPSLPKRHLLGSGIQRICWRRHLPIAQRETCHSKASCLSHSVYKGQKITEWRQLDQVCFGRRLFEARTRSLSSMLWTGSLPRNLPRASSLSEPLVSYTIRL